MTFGTENSPILSRPPEDDDIVLHSTAGYAVHAANTSGDHREVREGNRVPSDSAIGT